MNRPHCTPGQRLMDRVDRLEWLCDACKKSVGDGDGWLTVDWLAAIAVMEAKAEPRHAHPPGVRELRLITAAELMRSHPRRQAWRVYHRACDPDPDRDAYWFAVERCRTMADLVDWWLHLGQKNWFTATDWEGLVRHQVMPQLGAQHG